MELSKYPLSEVKNVGPDEMYNIADDASTIKQLFPEGVFVLETKWYPQKATKDNLMAAVRTNRTTAIYSGGKPCHLAFGEGTYGTEYPVYMLHNFGYTEENIVANVIHHFLHFKETIPDLIPKVVLYVTFPENVNRDNIKKRLEPFFGEELRSRFHRNSQGVMVERKLPPMNSSKL